VAAQLWLQEARNVIHEPGCAYHWEFTPQTVETLRRALDSGYLRMEGMYHDRTSGVLMAQPSFDLSDMDVADWDFSGSDVPSDWASNAESPSPWYTEAGGTYTRALAHRGDGAWTAISDNAEWGEPRWLRWVTYDRENASRAEVLTVYFGIVWRLRLFGTGKADLAKQDLGAGAYTVCAVFDWLADGRYSPATHWLWIYEIGPRLVIRSMLNDFDGRRNLGLVYYDDAPGVDPTDPDQRQHALRAGPYHIEGEGLITLSCCRQMFADYPDPLLELVEADTVGIAGEGSTQPLSVTLAGWSSDGVLEPTVTAEDENGSAWPQTGGAFVPARHKLRWSLGWVADEEQTYFLSGLDLALARVIGSDGAAGTQIIGTAADKQLTLAREGGLDRERFTASLVAMESLAHHVQPNMLVRLVDGGATRFRGFTSGADWKGIADADTESIGALSLQAEGLWRRFTRAVWPGGEPFDGRKLTDCLADVVRTAGLAPAEYSIASDPYTLPSVPEGDAPALVYRPGTKIDRILADLREKFFGTRLQMYFRMTDGVFVVAAAPTSTSPAAYFYQTSALAIAGGTPGQVILSGTYEQTLDDSEMANLVAVIGQGPDEQPLLARAMDWASVRDRTVWNYVGAVYPLIVADPGLATQAAVNYVCRSLFDRHRYPRINARWRSHRVDLWPGDVVELVGPAYGQTYRLTGITAELAADGDAADPLGRSIYQGELIR
jgi:hypothetical protein